MKTKTLVSIIAISVIVLTASFSEEQNTENLSEAQGQWQIDNAKSTMQFSINTLWIFPVKGTMSGIHGKINITNNPDACSAQLTLKTKTIDTGNDKRDNHLRSEDFFEVDKYPEINFTSNSFKKTDGDYPYAATGMLTIKDVTQEKSVPFKFEGIEKINGSEYARFTGETEVNRNDFHIDYSGPKARTMGDVATLTFTMLAKRQ